MAPDMVSVSAGEVTHVTREAARERFGQYFGRVDFLAWDDLEAPVVTFSYDHTMATVLVQKVVRIRPVGRVDAPVNETRFAWLEVWRRTGDRWEMTANVSTNARPAPYRPVMPRRYRRPETAL
jgi:hypothetical protein